MRRLACSLSNWPELDSGDELSLFGATYEVAGGIPPGFRMALKTFERELKRARAIEDVLDLDSVEDAERLKMLAEAGLAERKDLEDEVVKFASTLGTVKGSLEMRELRKMLQGADRMTLLTQREGLRRKIPKTDLLDATASGDGKDAGPGKERPRPASAYPAGDLTHWGSCRKTAEPILLRGAGLKLDSAGLAHPSDSDVR